MASNGVVRSASGHSWKKKYDTVVKGHVWMDLEIQIAPGGDHPPGDLYVSRGCASGLFRLSDRNTSFFLPSPDRPIKACLALKSE
jgi:hypothetical protein